MSFKPGDRVEVDLGVVKVEGKIISSDRTTSEEFMIRLDNGTNVITTESKLTLITPPEEVYFLPIYKGGRIVPQTSGLPPKSLDEAIFSAAASYEVETFLEVVVRARHGKLAKQDEEPTIRLEEVVRAGRPEGLGKGSA